MSDLCLGHLRNPQVLKTKNHQKKVYWLAECDSQRLWIPSVSPASSKVFICVQKSSDRFIASWVWGGNSETRTSSSLPQTDTNSVLTILALLFSPSCWFFIVNHWLCRLITIQSHNLLFWFWSFCFPFFDAGFVEFLSRITVPGCYHETYFKVDF